MKKKIKFSSISDFPKNFIGISSHFKDIQVVWSLNNLTELNFSKAEDFQKKIKGSETVFHFSMFRYIDDQNIKHYLITNKNNDAILFPKYKTIDYIFISNVSVEKLNTIINNISKSKMIIGNFILPVNNLISKTFKELFED